MRVAPILLLFALLGAGQGGMLTVTPCFAPGGLADVLAGFGMVGDWQARASLWERFGNGEPYQGLAAENDRLERAVLANLERLGASRPGLVDLLSLLGQPADFAHRGRLYAHYVDRREAYRGSWQQNEGLAAAIVEGMAAARPLRTGVTAGTLGSGGGLPAKDKDAARLWRAQYSTEEWTGDSGQRERLVARMAARWLEKNWGTGLADILDYLGFRSSSNGKRILWERHRRRIYRNTPYRGSSRQNRDLAKWLVKDYAVGQARSGGLEVLVTAYNPLPEQTDDTPDITATGRRVREGYVAVSRDLEGRFPMGARLQLLVVCEVNSEGECVKEIGELYEFEVQDRMHRRKRRQVDVFLMCQPEALAFGRRHAVVYPV